MSKPFLVQEKMLVTSIFSPKTFPKWFSVRVIKTQDLLAKGLTLSQLTNFRLFQTERVCIRQFQFWSKWRKVLQNGRKYRGRRNLLLQAISPFPNVFKKLVLQTSTNKGLFGKGLRLKLVKQKINFLPHVWQRWNSSNCSILTPETKHSYYLNLFNSLPLYQVNPCFNSLPHNPDF